MTNAAQKLGQGATMEAGGVRFRLWAPGCDSVAVLLEADGRAVPMRPQPGDFFEVFIQRAGAGTLYRYRLPNGLTVPDPASRFQPRDVHGPSEVIDPNGFLDNVVARVRLEDADGCFLVLFSDEPPAAGTDLPYVEVVAVALTMFRFSRPRPA